MIRLSFFICKQPKSLNLLTIFYLNSTKFKKHLLYPSIVLPYLLLYLDTIPTLLYLITFPIDLHIPIHSRVFTMLLLTIILLLSIVCLMFSMNIWKVIDQNCCASSRDFHLFRIQFHLRKSRNKGKIQTMHCIFVCTLACFLCTVSGFVVNYLILERFIDFVND